MTRTAGEAKVARSLEHAFALAQDVLKDPDAYPDRFIAIPFDRELLSRIFSEERIRLVKHVRGKGSVSSVKVLARSLGRDATRVGRDVAELERVGLLRVERRGKAKRLVADRKPILIA